MSGPRVFVSAGFPSGDRGKPFVPYDTGAIGFAATEVVRAVLEAEGRIVFGAQPAISPLVLRVAVELGRREVVDVYQSRFFEKDIPGETMRLINEGYAVPHWTERVPGESEKDPKPSLALMRTEMLEEAEPPDAAVFIGGMEGILGEYEMLRARPDGVPLLPLTAPGGAARKLKPSDDRVAERLAPVLGSPYYPDVAREIVAALR
jgi:SLOG cluster3 family